MTSDMRKIIDSLDDKQTLDEGIIDSIRGWIRRLSDPVKQKGAQNLMDFAKRLENKYSAQVPQQVKSTNKEWVWSKVTYKDLFNFTTSVLGASSQDLDRALRNNIVTNNMKYVVALLQDEVEKPTLPLTSGNIQNNMSVISPTVDPQTKQYLSKAIAIAILDVLAYIEQQSIDTNKSVSVPQSGPGPDTTTTQAAPASSPGIPTNPEDIRAAIVAIKQGLAAMKGTIQ